MQSFETWSGTRLSATGKSCITSGLAQIGGIAFYGTAPGRSSSSPATPLGLLTP
jgi:hypothetical protein